VAYSDAGAVDTVGNTQQSYKHMQIRKSDWLGAKLPTGSYSILARLQYDQTYLKLVWNAFGAEFYGFELDVVGVAFEGDLADECGKQFFVLAFVGPVG